jgi:hypothetical protein
MFLKIPGVTLLAACLISTTPCMPGQDAGLTLDLARTKPV